MTDRIEAQLVAAAAAGDIDSFGKLCEHYYAPMVSIAYSVLSDHQLAEDAAQEAFARALGNLRKLNNVKKFGPWLGRICRNVAIDTIRAKARAAGGPEPVRADSNEPQMDMEAVRSEIQQLPQADRELLVLKYYNDLSYEQIAAVLNISRGAINGRLTRAKRKLAKRLERRGILEKEA